MMCCNPQTVCARLIEQSDGYFGPVFQEELLAFLSAVEEQLTVFLQRRPTLACSTEAILFSLGGSLFDRLFQLCVRSFLGELYYAKEDLRGDTPEARYQDFLRRYLLPRRELLLADSTELGKLVSRQVSESLAAFEELLNRFDQDFDSLETVLGTEIRSIDDWNEDGGDQHNHGRVVVILTVNKSEKLVYKPHSLENDRILTGLIQWLNQTGELSAPMRHLRVLSRSTYGWQEFVSNRACESEEEAELYMYRLGTVTFLAFLCSCCDLHYENLIANGDAPILIDTETLFANRYYLKKYHLENIDSWKQFLMHSVFLTGLIPVDILPGDSFEREIGNGILTGLSAQKKPLTIQTVLRPGTDEMGFSEKEIALGEAVHNNLPYFAGRPLHAGEYIETISKGFQDAYHATLNHRMSLLELVCSGFFAKGVYRQIIRSTELYGKYLSASCHPSYLESKEARMAVFGKLKGKRDYYSPEHECLVQSEIRQLMQGDIPYFYTTFSSRALLSPDGCVAENFYHHSIEEEFLAAVNNLSEADCFRQLFCLRRALTEHLDQKARFYPIQPSVFDAPDPISRIAGMTDWIISLREYYFRIPQEDTEFPLYLSNVPGRDAVLLKPEPAILYSGIGSTLFYFQYTTVRKRGHKLFEAMLRSVSSPDSPLRSPLLLSGADRSIGVFDGQGSALYLSLYLYRAAKDAKYLHAAELICRRMLLLVKENREVWDVMSGHAGVIICCLNAWHKLPDLDVLRSLAETCGEMLFEAYSTGILMEQTGFAHGYAGISTAFLMLSGVNGSEAYYAAGLELMRWESAQYDPGQKGWKTMDGSRDGMNAWCYGAPGILIARELARPYLKDADRPLAERDIEHALSCTGEAVRSGDIRPLLCHGLPGNLSALQWYAKRAGDSSASRTADQGLTRLLQMLQRKGILMHDATNTLQISFMDGLCGLGYYLLQQLQPDIPTVLALELP